MRTRMLICVPLLASVWCFAQQSTSPTTETVATQKSEAVPATAKDATPSADKAEPASAVVAADKKETPSPVASEPASPITPPTTAASASNNLMMIDYVKSDLKWRLGFRKEPYNKLSAHTAEALSKSLAEKQIKSTEKLEEGCCKLTLELLQVSTRQAMIKDPGIDVSANLTVSDAKGKVIYSKGYRGRSGTYFMNTWGHLIDHACEDMVANMLKDDLLLAVLRDGKMPQ